MNETQWVHAPEKYLNVDLYEGSEKLSNIYSLSESYSETMGIFLSLEGKHEATFTWHDNRYQRSIPNGKYELVISVIIHGEEKYFDEISFNVKKSYIIPLV